MKKYDDTWEGWVLEILKLPCAFVMVVCIILLAKAFL